MVNMLEPKCKIPAMKNIYPEELQWLADARDYCDRHWPTAIPHTDEIDIAWLAGLLEGEASFIYSKKSPKIALQMSDEDVVAEAATLLGATVRAPWRREEHFKFIYGAHLYGVRAVVWMLTIFPLMGNRRRSKIRDIVDRWMLEANPKAPRGHRWPALCHPDRVRVGDGLCRKCYMREYRKRRREKQS